MKLENDVEFDAPIQHRPDRRVVYRVVYAASDMLRFTRSFRRSASKTIIGIHDDAMCTDLTMSIETDAGRSKIDAEVEWIKRWCDRRGYRMIESAEYDEPSVSSSDEDDDEEENDDDDEEEDGEDGNLEGQPAAPDENIEDEQPSELPTYEDEEDEQPYENEQPMYEEDEDEDEQPRENEQPMYEDEAEEDQ